MNLSELKVLIIEDDPVKDVNITNALKNCGVQNIESVSYLEKGFDIICQRSQSDSPLDLIVTDMQYPLSRFGMEVADAGKKLIERLKKKSLNIPVIVCSYDRYDIPDILGCVWCNGSSDLNREFRKLLEQQFQTGGE